jgi:hypothetical protein
MFLLFLKSSVIAISTGIRISVINVAKISPKAREIRLELDIGLVQRFPIEAVLILPQSLQW